MEGRLGQEYLLHHEVIECGQTLTRMVLVRV